MDIKAKSKGRRPVRKKLLIIFSTVLIVLGFTASGIANNLVTAVGWQLSEAQSMFALGIGLLGFSRFARKNL
jgi:hypothetical protein